ncbi:uncharacterized protein [Heterodontus francisci]|uniref:uncharacterized protein n=1 Tax=Heterodontus francisci TaxID=7792 RepID=UPI00355B0AC0
MRDLITGEAVVLVTVLHRVAVTVAEGQQLNSGRFFSPYVVSNRRSVRCLQDSLDFSMTEIKELVGFKNSSAKSLINGQIYEYEYEYYELDVSFDGLKANKYSIVIAFWVGLAVFMIFLFIILMLMSRSGSTPAQNYNLRKKAANKFNGSNGRQVQEVHVSNCAVSSLLPVNTGDVASVNLNNEQKCLEVSEGPQSLRDNTVIPGKVIP